MLTPRYRKKETIMFMSLVTINRPAKVIPTKVQINTINKVKRFAKGECFFLYSVISFQFSWSLFVDILSSPPRSFLYSYVNLLNQSQYSN